MAIRHELILEPADMDRISIQCKNESCSTRVLLSRKHLAIPAKCPSCPDEWGGIVHVVKQYFDALEKLKEYNVAFHVAAGAGGKASQPVGVLPQTEGGD